MAKPTTRSWTKLSLWVGDGASPEDFTSYTCGMTTKEFTLSGTTTDVEVPDCDDPDAAIWIERVIRSLSAGFTGSGVMAEETYPFFRTWMLSGAAKNVRVVLELGTPGYYAGSFLMTSLGTPSSIGDGKVNASVALASNGPVTWAAGVP